MLIFTRQRVSVYKSDPRQSSTSLTRQIFFPLSVVPLYARRKKKHMREEQERTTSSLVVVMFLPRPSFSIAICYLLPFFIYIFSERKRAEEEEDVCTGPKPRKWERKLDVMRRSLKDSNPTNKNKRSRKNKK